MSKSWLITTLISFLTAWLVSSFVAYKIDLPEELESVFMGSSAELKAQLAEEMERIELQESIVKILFILLGTSLVPGLILAWQSRTHRVLILLATLVLTALCAAAVGYGGLALREQFNAPGVQGVLSDPMLRDSVFFIVISLCISIPLSITFCLSDHCSSAQQAAAIPLAFALGGFLLPIAVSVFPSAQTQLFPPDGSALKAVWLGLIGTFTALLPGMLSPPAKTETEDQHEDESSPESE